MNKLKSCFFGMFLIILTACGGGSSIVDEDISNYRLKKTTTISNIEGGETTTVTTHKYNDLNQLVIDEITNEANDIIRKIEYKYDKSNNLVEKIDITQSYTDQTEFFYSNDLLVKEVLIYENQIEYQYEIIERTNSNPTLEKISYFNNGELFKTLVRKNTYIDNVLRYFEVTHTFVNPPVEDEFNEFSNKTVIGDIVIASSTTNNITNENKKITSNDGQGNVITTTDTTLIQNEIGLTASKKVFTNVNSYKLFGSYGSDYFYSYEYEKILSL